MNSRKLFLTLVALIAASFILSSCGGIKIAEGDLGFLKGQAKIKIKYDYDNMAVGKFAHEEDYTKEKVAKYNEDQPGKGDNWLRSWKNDRGTRFQPRFEELFDKYLNKINVSGSPSYDDAKYTMIVKTTFTEPGYNVVISRKNASINVEIIFVETKNPGKALCVLKHNKVQGYTYGGYDFDTGTRIMEAYSKLGKDLAKFLIDYF